ncbi:DGQHR domain-containing protein [Galbibacter sp. EGI 63066]|uniref:DGQHR domain-containing protein n=1 Tax=Galbibacter sp. EGI 63066 TaxID=2993559 RepID=UPI002249978B|nr:DGQHR domain-containing protein [Galbibacter sp. EGI 63066]MCX2681840.1 DGQHR domain-containing protein [Galbibacter sp. EGI 63066]
MSKTLNLEKLKTSWTKYDAVKVINIIGNDELESYLKGEQSINDSVLKSYLGIKNLSDDLPNYWIEVLRNYPNHRKLFTLLAGIFTHHKNIADFANKYSGENMEGIFLIEENDKHQTNLRSALVEGGASSNSFRRKPEVPYRFDRIFAVENIGAHFKSLLEERLKRIGHKEKEIQDNFFKLAYSYDFHKALSLNKSQFKKWLEGKSITQIKKINYSLKNFIEEYSKVDLIKINQWLANWDSVNYDEPMRSKPEKYFYFFKMDIRLLKRLSDVHRRKSSKSKSKNTNIQRELKEDRTQEIHRYVESGFPLSTLSKKDRELESNDVLKMPGFLPTAILINILGPNEKRGNSEIQSEDLISIKEEGKKNFLDLPQTVFDENWDPELKPIEVIDGQHRLWAFDETEEIEGDYEVPVIAYYNLDRAWQAYLFYVINIKPKKINTSLGYDLYPLLRTQEWLENSKDGLSVYRETRAQELVEALWSYNESPWHRRISMLGNDTSNISQNAFVRALSSTYLKKSIRKKVSGLFADVLYNKNHEEIKWVRPQQAAFLILIWDEISRAVDNADNIEWIKNLEKEPYQLTLFERELKLSKAFVTKNSNLSRDQGVTGISMFSNDFFYVLANESDINFNDLEWNEEIDERQIETESIDLAISEFKNHSLYTYIQYFAQEIVRFDWRTSNAPFDDENKREIQKKYRGSGGYRDVWRDLLKQFVSSNNEKIKKYAIILNEISK